MLLFNINLLSNRIINKIGNKLLNRNAAGSIRIIITLFELINCLTQNLNLYFCSTN